jgi:hypothetical protein
MVALVAVNVCQGQVDRMRRHHLALVDHVARRAIRGVHRITDLGVLEPRRRYHLDSA